MCYSANLLQNSPSGSITLGFTYHTNGSSSISSHQCSSLNTSGEFLVLIPLWWLSFTHATCIIAVMANITFARQAIHCPVDVSKKNSATNTGITTTRDIVRKFGSVSRLLWIRFSAPKMPLKEQRLLGKNEHPSGRENNARPIPHDLIKSH